MRLKRSMKGRFSGSPAGGTSWPAPRSGRTATVASLVGAAPPSVNTHSGLNAWSQGRTQPAAAVAVLSQAMPRRAAMDIAVVGVRPTDRPTTQRVATSIAMVAW